MSSTELRIGTLTELGEQPEGDTEYEQALKLKDRYGFEYLDEGDVWSEEVMRINGVWYEVEYSVRTTDDCGEIVEARADSAQTDTIHFVCQWHNGGAGFNEVIQDALQRMGR